MGEPVRRIGDLFARGAEAGRAHHPVADRKAFHARPESEDAAGELARGRERGRGLQLVFALDDEGVEEVERRIGDFDDNFALAPGQAARRP